MFWRGSVKVAQVTEVEEIKVVTNHHAYAEN
jgi:hypothetical protein